MFINASWLNSTAFLWYLTTVPFFLVSSTNKTALQCFHDDPESMHGGEAAAAAPGCVQVAAGAASAAAAAACSRRLLQQGLGQRQSAAWHPPPRP